MDFVSILIDLLLDEEMSPRTKHKRSASSESPRCLIENSFPSFIEPGCREVPIDVEMTSVGKYLKNTMYIIKKSLKIPKG